MTPYTQQQKTTMLGIMVYPPIRYEIMNLLCQHAYRFSKLRSVLRTKLDISDGNLVWHLDKLRLAGAVSKRKDGEYQAASIAVRMMNYFNKHRND